MDASIIIPTYNRLWSLPDAIASCPHQENVEIIVVDDGSTDGTWEWLRAQPDVRAIRQSNWGKPRAVNAGFAAATGDYVKFLDSDDLLFSEAVVDQLSQCLADQPDISVAAYQAWYEETDTRVLHRWADCGDFLAQQLGERDSSHYSAYFFRRGFVADVLHRPEYAFRDDRMFVIECALRQPRVTIFDEPTLLHRHHSKPRLQFQLGSTAVVTNWQELRMFRRAIALMDEQGLLTDRRKAAMGGNIWALALRIGAHDRREGAAVIDFLRTLVPEFTIPKTGRDRLYRMLGYPMAQPIVDAARAIRDTGRRVANQRGKGDA